MVAILSTKKNHCSEKVTILIAEDDNDYFYLLQRHFREIKLQNEVVRFKNGLEVLDYLWRFSDFDRESLACHLLVMDLNMPAMSGVDVLRIINESETLKGIPVVIYSSSIDDYTIDLCNSLGCQKFVTKTGSINDLDEIFESIL